LQDDTLDKIGNWLGAALGFFLGPAIYLSDTGDEQRNLFGLLVSLVIGFPFGFAAGQLIVRFVPIAIFLGIVFAVIQLIYSVLSKVHF